MKYICNGCGKVIQEHDTTIHYTKSSNVLEIVAICQLCLEKYLENKKEDSYRKKDETERMEMKRKW
jgi:ribosome-binding protein aMBF1 (putative translation factor)